jgi:hypothetical protein
LPKPLPVAISARYAITLIAMIACVATGAAAVSARAWTTRVLCLAHSGQRMPTAVEVMQSGQIGRPQFEQETPVSRVGWR